jgi:hypothetical protein
MMRAQNQLTACGVTSSKTKVRPNETLSFLREVWSKGFRTADDEVICCQISWMELMYYDILFKILTITMGTSPLQKINDLICQIYSHFNGYEVSNNRLSSQFPK